MFATKQFSFDHGHAANSCAECHHHDICIAASCTGIGLTEKRHASVILDA